MGKRRRIDLTGARDQCMTSMLDMTQEVGKENMEIIIDGGIIKLERAGLGIAAIILALGADVLFTALEEREEIDDELNS